LKLINIKILYLKSEKY